MCRSRPRSTRKARTLSRGGFSTYVQCVHMTGGLCGPCERGLSAGAADWVVLSVRMLCAVWSLWSGPLASRSARARRLTSFIPTIHSTALSLSHYPIRIRFTRFIALCVVVQPFSPLEAAPRAIGRAFTRGSYRPAPVCFALRTLVMAISETRLPLHTTTAHMQGERVSSNATREKWAECARVHGARARPDYSASASTPRGIYGRRAAARCTLAT